MTSNTQNVRLAISTCPNDTFAFHGLMNQCVDLRGLEFEIDLIDIQELNDRLFQGNFDIAKASFFAALLLAHQTVVLPSGSALGYGVGPLLLAARPDERPTDDTQLALCPGQHTTASLLFSLFHSRTSRVENCLFSDIMPRLQSGSADFGVCIHEGRFTWEQAGLSLVEDLGTRWEAETGCPLPLGGIVANRQLPAETITRVQQVIHDSIQFALNDPDVALPTMRKYAQEFDDDVLMQHVDLYVNEWTIDLGPTGAGALEKLSTMGQSIGLVSEGVPRLEVWRS